MVGYESIQVYATLSGFPSGVSHSEGEFRITRQLLHRVSTASFESCRVHFHWNIRLLPARPARLKSCWALPSWSTLHVHTQLEYSWAYSIDQQQLKTTSYCPVQHIEQSKCIKITIDTNIQLTQYKALHFSE
jgi:hypothetical protein